MNVEEVIPYPSGTKVRCIVRSDAIFEVVKDVGSSRVLLLESNGNDFMIDRKFLEPAFCTIVPSRSHAEDIPGRVTSTGSFGGFEKL